MFDRLSHIGRRRAAFAARESSPAPSMTKINWTALALQVASQAAAMGCLVPYPVDRPGEPLGKRDQR